MAHKKGHNIFAHAFYVFALYMEPDYGAIVVLTATVMGMIFLGGMKPLQLVTLVTIVSTLVGAMAALSFAMGFMVPLAFAQALAPHPEIAGTASTLSMARRAAVLRDGHLYEFDTLEEAKQLYDYDTQGA